MTINKTICTTIVLLGLLPTLAISDYLNCPCKVIKVTDGDTVHVLDQANARHKIRLGGIDAPEKKQIYGDKSTQNLTNLIAGPPAGLLRLPLLNKLFEHITCHATNLPGLNFTLRRYQECGW